MKPIGFFDSGFGGLDVMRSVVRRLPMYDYVYLGDTARSPYGTRSADLVYAFSKQAVSFLFDQGCELIVFACNTASSEALLRIQKECLTGKYSGKKILGVLIPAAEDAVQRTRNGKIGVMATAGTVRSGSFGREIKKIDPKIQVVYQACPLLVPIVEAGEHQSPIARMAVKQYVSPLVSSGIDTIILGCTHYGILESLIREIVGENIHIVSEAKVVPSKLEQYLNKHSDMHGLLSKGGKILFYSTDITENFSILGSVFFGKRINVQRAVLAE